MPTLGMFDANDIEILRKIVRSNRRKYGNNAGSRDDGALEDIEPGNIYVARTPSTGIRGLVSARPGYATCAIYVIQDTSTTPSLFPIEGYSEVVYNVAISSVPGSTWIPIGKDKSGRWLALGSGNVPALNTVIDPTPRHGTGTGTRLGTGVHLDKPLYGTGTGIDTNPYGTGSPASVNPVTSSVEFVTSVSCVDGVLTYNTSFMQFVNGLFVGVSDRVALDIPIVIFPF